MPHSVMDGFAFMAPLFDGFRRAVPPGTIGALGTFHLYRNRPGFGWRVSVVAPGRESRRERSLRHHRPLPPGLARRLTTSKTMKFRDGFKLTSKANRRLPTEYFVLADVAFEGAVIGYLAGRPIREAVSDRDGLRYRFVGVAPRLPGGGFDVLALRSGEWIVLPGLVYAADAKESATPNEADRAA